MSIFLNVNNLAIKGQASDKNHNQWIEIKSYNFRTARNVSMSVGQGDDRSVGHPQFNELEFIKETDNSGVFLMQSHLKSTYYPNVIMEVCQTGDGLQTNTRYTFDDALFTSYEQVGHADGSHLEIVTLNFSKMEQRIYPRNKDGSTATPVGAGYDLGTAQST